MFSVLMNNIEQLAASLDFQKMGDANNARFSLILVDNVIEVALHQFALDINAENEHFKHITNGKIEKYDSKKVKEAVGQRFDCKVRLGKDLCFLSDEVCRTVLICHSYRNQLYHAGVRHEVILPALAKFYLILACDLLAEYNPPYFGYVIGQPVSQRAQRYFGVQARQVSEEQYRVACLELKNEAQALPGELIDTLAAHMKSTVEECDEGLDFLANGGPEKITRDEVVSDRLLWALAFSDEMRAYAEKNGCLAKQGDLGYMKWLHENYKWKRTRDPISDWKRRIVAFEAIKNPHSALEKYEAFMNQEKYFLVGLKEAVRSLDDWIELQIDIARGK